MNLKQKIELIKNEIHETVAGTKTNPDNVRIICVTKYAKIEDVISIIKLGYYNIAENYLQEVSRKKELLKSVLSLEQFEKINWHFIGHLQRNKAAEVIKFASLIQSVDSLRLAERIDQIAAKTEEKVNILIQVDISNEESKFGISFLDLEELLDKVLKLPNLKIQGLMGIGPLVEDPEASRIGFKQLKFYFDKMNVYLQNNKYPRMTTLSMGMSNDYKIALQEGSTMIRIGSAIFGG